jgi:hypothetical protein
MLVINTLYHMNEIIKKSWKLRVGAESMVEGRIKPLRSGLIIRGPLTAGAQKSDPEAEGEDT